jgi:class 3 adenylate cyclase
MISSPTLTLFLLHVYIQLGEDQLALIDLRLRSQCPAFLPHYQDIRGSILILDLSGFTKLGETLRSQLGPRDGAAEFAHKVNEALSVMVQHVYDHLGDVLKLAGDALICLFEDKDYEGGSGRLSVEEQTMKRVRDCSLSVLGNTAKQNTPRISVHGGAAHGTIRCFYLGTPSSQPGNCTFAVCGCPLQQSGKLLGKAGRGEVYIDGEVSPLTEKMGVQYIEKCRRPLDVNISIGHVEVMPRDSQLLTDSEFLIEHTGGFEVNANAKAYLGTLAARRCDQGSQNAMSILLNELRPVAIVFVGLHDFNDMCYQDSTLLELVNEAFKTLSRITHACNGAVRDMLFDDKGCVFISVFGAHSYEVNPCFDATVCAMRMESALKKLLKRFSLGVSYGECFCGEVGPSIRSDYVVMGPEVNLAARLMKKATNRSTLVSKRIFTHSKGHIHFEKSEEIQVKGKDGFFHAYIPLKRIERRLTLELADVQQPFVIVPSRQRAIDILMKAEVRASAKVPTVTFVSGAPFLGKSRLLNEVARRAAVDGFMVLKSFRTSLDSFTSFFPLRQIISEALVIGAKKESGGDIGDEISAANYLVDQNILNKTDLINIGSIVPTVADAQLRSLLSGINPVARTKSIVDSVIKILRLLQPLLIILEGDGEIDSSSWSLLAELMHRACSECPQIMLIVSSRDSPTITSDASDMRKNAIKVKLIPFDKYETELYLRMLLGIKDESITIEKQLLDVVHDRANGCPFFIECVVRWALEKHVIEYVGGTKKMRMLMETTDDVRVAIPRELSNILLSPFNKLPPPLWDALKIASCIGYSFDTDLYSTLNQGFCFTPKIEELASKYDCFERKGSHYRWKQQAVSYSLFFLLLANSWHFIPNLFSSLLFCR